MSVFQLKEPRLAVSSRSVSRQRTICRHDTVTRDDEGDGIAPDGLPDSLRRRPTSLTCQPAGSLISNSIGQITVRGRLPVGNCEELAPHTDLEISADQAQARYIAPVSR